MLRATEILPAGTWPATQACDAIALDYDERHRRRMSYTAQAGTAFLLDLPRVTVMNDGDGLQLDDGRVIRIIAADEDLVEITAPDAETLVRLAWHIGNRHQPAQLSTSRILIRDDHVIVAMLHGLGASTHSLRAPFTPEGGAYAASHAHGGGEHAQRYVLLAGRGH
mgnify:CR=1 FL=1